MQVSECSVPALANTFYRLLFVLGYKGKNYLFKWRLWIKSQCEQGALSFTGAVYSGTEEVPPTAGLTQELGQGAYLFTRTSGLNTTEFFISRKPFALLYSTTGDQQSRE